MPLEFFFSIFLLFRIDCNPLYKVWWSTMIFTTILSIILYIKTNKMCFCVWRLGRDSGRFLSRQTVKRKKLVFRYMMAYTWWSALTSPLQYFCSCMLVRWCSRRQIYQVPEKHTKTCHCNTLLCANTLLNKNDQIHRKAQMNKCSHWRKKL